MSARHPGEGRGGIQKYQVVTTVLDPGFRRGDDFLRVRHSLSAESRCVPFSLSFLAKDIMGAYAPQLHDSLIESQGQSVSFADANFEPVGSAEFLQPQGMMAEVLEKKTQLFIDPFPDLNR